jgi:PAS domain-containing protein
MEDRRQQHRHRTLKAGKIVFNNKRSMFDCLVRNLSQSGACLQINSSIDIPHKFELQLDGESAGRQCQLVWATDTRAGIEFSTSSVAKDATLAKATGDALVASEDSTQISGVVDNELLTLRTALDLVPIGIVLLDAEMRAQFVNRSFRRMWRLPDEKADCRPPFVALLYHGCDTRAYAIPSGDLDRYVAERIAHVESGDPKPLDLRLTTGEVIRVHCTALPSGGRMLCYTYVTDLVKGVEHLAMLRGSLDQMQQGILLLDECLNAQFMNRAVRELWGVRDDRLIENQRSGNYSTT